MLETVTDLLISPPNLGDFNPQSTLTPSGCPIEWTFASHPETLRYTLDLHARQIPEHLRPLMPGLTYCWVHIQKTGSHTRHQLLKLHNWNDPDPLYLEDCVPVLSGFHQVAPATETHYLHQEPTPQSLEMLLQDQHSPHLPAFWNDLRFLSGHPTRTLPRKSPITLVMQQNSIAVQVPASVLFPDEQVARRKVGQWFIHRGYTEAMQHSGLMHTTLGWEFTPTRLVRTVGVTLRNWR
ncbi:hypothetical protein DC3_41030 [Deinococcus cellulosilyticus NBRC 106333 = KACC 11606]|uniref:Uncharacterized protein n=2 Tax=Deinococcus cellulosilyticus TaxID=401558 RepID=A0A511N7L4_DEIC1|nr:hypothetical protein DC3_41030 [Deinococcus cellulosilyticus NBRC 106333 = KACC 11606]